LIFCLHGFGQEYFARGEIQTVLKNGPTDTGKREVLGFYVEVVVGNYKIRMDELRMAGAYYEYAYENQVMHIIHHTTTSSNLGSTRAAKTTNLFPARVEMREIPPNDGTFAQYVWLALASSHYFTGQTNVMMPPIWHPEDPATRKQPFDMLFQHEKMTLSPGLPKQIMYFNDGYYRAYNPASKASDVIKLPSPYDKGYTNAVYQTLSFTNLGEITLPEVFVFCAYSTPLNQGQVPFERLLVKGVVKEVGVRILERAKLGKFEGVASVADYRLVMSGEPKKEIDGQKYVPYQITNGMWPDASQLAKIKAQGEQITALRILNKQRRWITQLIVFVSVCVPVLWLGKVLIQKLKKNTKEENE